MQLLVNAKEMQHYDAHTQHIVGIPSLVLMERAALAIVERLTPTQAPTSFNLTKIAVICGYGNNGGDGVAVARLLKILKFDVCLYFVGDPNRCSPETQTQINIAKYHHVPMLSFVPKSFAAYTTIIDAMIGIGLHRPITGELAIVIDMINQSGADILSVDMPTGISSDTGKVHGIAVKAKQTVTFAYPKIGQILYPGAEFTGKFVVADIGIYADKCSACYTYDTTNFNLASHLPARPNYSNKGSFGKVLVIAGSENMSGAAYFSAKAAYRTGAGLVKIYTHAANRNILLSQLPEALMTIYQSNQIDEQQLKQAINWASVIVIGPGMGESEDTYQILSTVLKQAKIPVIIDADGLNCLQQNLALLDNCPSDIIVTPHLGEMARFTKLTIPEIANNLIDTATQFANKHNIICILKDARSMVATPNGQTYINQSGNNGMATAGSGDVLTGILAGLLAQQLPANKAAQLAVLLHGMAGDIAAKSNGKNSLMASDIIDSLSQLLG